MIIFDSTTLSFARKAEAMVKEILLNAGFEVRRSRFMASGLLYPIHVVIFEGPEWGHFNTAYYQIGLNRKLMTLAKDSVVRDILKHELAHYLTSIFHGDVSHHGSEFKSVCEKFGFHPDIAAATMNLDESNLSKEGDLSSERILSKVKKLLELSRSSNTHEAELATLKANELLLRHNLDYLNQRDQSFSGPLYLERILARARKDAKLTAIYDILRHFIVRPVISFGKNTCCLEVSGTLTNVKLAVYVAEFLDRELDHLWELTKTEHRLTGLRAKNSFFLGVAKGFDEKMKKSKASFSLSDQKALVVVERKLSEEVCQIYRRLSSSSSSHQSDERARELGVQKGNSLTIRNAVEGSRKNLYLP